jgi:hypothetical protein
VLKPDLSEKLVIAWQADHVQRVRHPQIVHNRCSSAPPVEGMTILLIAFTLRGFALGHAFMQQEIHRGLVQRFLRLPANAAKISRVHAPS